MQQPPLYRHQPQTSFGAEIPVRIQLENATLSGDLHVPEDARGLVIFAHGSGSSRFSPRNRYVAQALHDVKMGTFLVDLLTSEEEIADTETGFFRFDIPRLAERLVHITEWAESQDEIDHLPIGLFGASTGAGAALIAAARRPDAIRAVVSRGGRVDLARSYLEKVIAPTLLIVGEYDEPVIELNSESQRRLRCAAELKIVPGAGHLFEERGALEEVSRLATSWFRHYLR